VQIDHCLYIGENLIEVIGATAAGIQALQKLCLPAAIYLFKQLVDRRRCNVISTIQEDFAINAVAIINLANYLAKWI
jgi:hypothetical protein